PVRRPGGGASPRRSRAAAGRPPPAPGARRLPAPPARRVPPGSTTATAPPPASPPRQAPGSQRGRTRRMAPEAEQPAAPADRSPRAMTSAAHPAPAGFSPRSVPRPRGPGVPLLARASPAPPSIWLRRLWPCGLRGVAPFVHLVATASACGLRGVAPFWWGGLGGCSATPPMCLASLRLGRRRPAGHRRRRGRHRAGRDGALHRREPDPRHLHVALLVRVERIVDAEVRRAEERPIVHPVEDL